MKGLQKAPVLMDIAEKSLNQWENFNLGPRC